MTNTETSTQGVKMTATEQDYVKVIKDQSDTIERFARTIDDLYKSVENKKKAIDALKETIDFKELSIQILEETVSIMKSRVDTKDAIIKVKEDMIRMLDEHINKIWKSEEFSIEPLAKKIDELENELVAMEQKYIDSAYEANDYRDQNYKLKSENDKWMKLCDKHLKRISNLEDWLTHSHGEIEYYQRKVEELSDLNDSYRETISDLDDRLSDKYKLFYPTVPDMNQVNESLDREPEAVSGLSQILEQLRNERLGINPVV
jgi:chromosome segregation ATPase